MNRREFITLLGGAAVAWPFAGRAQQAMPVIGYLSRWFGEVRAQISSAAFRKGLRETGYIEGQNVAIEYRWADNVRRSVAGISRRSGPTSGSRHCHTRSAAAALAAKAATTKIPIIFGIGTDAIQAGSGRQPQPARRQRHWRHYYAVRSLRQSESDFCMSCVPEATRFAVLVNPTNPLVTGPIVTDLEAATFGHRGANRSLSPQVPFATSTRLLRRLNQKRADALLVSHRSPLFVNRRVQLATLTARHALPTMYYDREFAEAGGLMSYGTSISDQYRQDGIYARPNPQGREAGRLCRYQQRPSSSSSSISNRQDARPRNTADPSRPRRRGDRMRRARVHHAARRRGGGVAARGARAAAERMRRIGVLDTRRR